MNIKPLQDRVIIRQVEEKKESAGGIILPGSAQEKDNVGEVVAVGPGKASTDAGTLIAMSVKVGDKVMFGYGGQDISDDNGNPLKVMREDDIIAIVG